MFLIHLQEASEAHFNKKNTSVVNLPTFYIHVMGFSSGTLPPKGSAPVSFHHNLTLRGFDRQAMGGKLIAKAGFKSTFVVSTFRGRDQWTPGFQWWWRLCDLLCHLTLGSLTFVAVEWWIPLLFPPKRTPGTFVWPRKLRWNLEFERNDDVICTAEDHGALIVAATSPQFCGCLHSYWSCSWSIIFIGNMPSQIEESGETHIFIPPEVQHSEWKGTIPHKENTHPTRHFSGAVRSYPTPKTHTVNNSPLGF